MAGHETWFRPASRAYSESASTYGPARTRTRWGYWLGGYLLYTLFHIVAAPFVGARFLHRMRRGSYRGALSTRLRGGSCTKAHRGAVWIVASGLGETRTAVHAADEISRSHPDQVAVLTQLARIPAGLRSEDSPFPIGYAPFNSPLSAMLSLARGRPKRILFVEFSGNYHLAFWARLVGVPTALVNVNLSERRAQRLLRKPLGKWQFSFVDGFSVQAEAHARRLVQLGVDQARIVVAGLGIGPLQLPGAGAEVIREKWSRILRVGENTPVVVAGSTYAAEDPPLLEAMREIWRTRQEAVLVLAPRNLDRMDELVSSLLAASLDFDRRSRLDDYERVAPIVILDTLGELREVYSVARVAHIGGTLIDGIGGHTPLEALAWGVPMTVGPYFGQQEAAVNLVCDAGYAEICTSAAQIAQVWDYALSKPDLRSELATRAHDVAGATALVNARALAALKEITPDR